MTTRQYQSVRRARRARRLTSTQRANRSALASMACGLALTVAAFGILAAADHEARQRALPPVLDRADTSCTTDSECQALDGDTVLIGIGCGPEKVVSYAREEDEFGFASCDVIEARRVVGSFKRGA